MTSFPERTKHSDQAISKSFKLFFPGKGGARKNVPKEKRRTERERGGGESEEESGVRGREGEEEREEGFRSQIAPSSSFLGLPAIAAEQGGGGEDTGNGVKGPPAPPPPTD